MSVMYIAFGSGVCLLPCAKCKLNSRDISIVKVAYHKDTETRVASSAHCWYDGGELCLWNMDDMTFSMWHTAMTFHNQ